MSLGIFIKYRGVYRGTPPVFGDYRGHKDRIEGEGKGGGGRWDWLGRDGEKMQTIVTE